MPTSKLPVTILSASILDSDWFAGKKNRLMPTTSKHIERPIVRKLVCFLYLEWDMIVIN